MLWITIAIACVCLGAVLLFRRRPSALPGSDQPSLGGAARAASTPPPHVTVPPPGDLDEEPELTRLGQLPNLGDGSDDDIDESDPGVAEQDEVELEEESTETTAPQAFILVTAIARTDVGMVRTHNEDALLAMRDENVYVVADGMGGHAAGELASKLAVETMESAFTTGQFPGLRRVTRHRRANELVRAIELANEKVLSAARANEAHKGMGTTIAAARFSPGRRRVYIANVGDSRVYRLREGTIQQLTTDHTLAVAAGVKGALGAELSRAVGVKKRVKVDLRIEDARAGDHFVVCSDGLTKMVPDEEILQLATKDPDLEAAAKRLVARANERGGKDNTSVILIRVDSAGSSIARMALTDR